MENIHETCPNNSRVTDYIFTSIEVDWKEKHYKGKGWQGHSASNFYFRSKANDYIESIEKKYGENCDIRRFENGLLIAN